jgi:hypothetical protein
MATQLRARSILQPVPVVDISNVILTGVKATGPVTPIAVNGIDGTGNAGFTITEPSGTGTTLYWVGGAGDWNNNVTGAQPAAVQAAPVFRLKVIMWFSMRAAALRQAAE